ncbi:MAG: hypothetical protein COW00_10970 [Bdellovibrio sp. CG12_big_fil_rev_8_21_14_0_65_39_13]|nr:MAG: hypothetical protein COW00_10970 [Bdellovibrio sp. CG12_big_fil_rev_8_21_14_0_65_39_13]PIR32255.1 MAG: hypothetical protein COV37_20260 [Bdellovibrio sp. CG11_big_fil_rev_8_21_14_0_20_39_38]
MCPWFDSETGHQILNKPPSGGFFLPKNLSQQNLSYNGEMNKAWLPLIISIPIFLIPFSFLVIEPTYFALFFSLSGVLFALGVIALFVQGPNTFFESLLVYLAGLLLPCLLYIIFRNQTGNIVELLFSFYIGTELGILVVTVAGHFIRKKEFGLTKKMKFYLEDFLVNTPQKYIILLVLFSLGLLSILVKAY